MAGSILQAASLKPIDANAHIIWQLSRSAQRSDFIKLYGDVGEDEFSATGGTIPQRLLLMNGNMVHERIKDNIVANAATAFLPRRAITHPPWRQPIWLCSAAGPAQRNPPILWPHWTKAAALPAAIAWPICIGPCSIPPSFPGTTDEPRLQ